MRTCYNCKNRRTVDSFGFEYCTGWEMAITEDDAIENAKDCCGYVLEEYEEGEDYCPSSTNRDYSPSNPWDAPGMSIRDFI